METGEIDVKKREESEKNSFKELYPQEMGEKRCFWAKMAVFRQKTIFLAAIHGTNRRTDRRKDQRTNRRTEGAIDGLTEGLMDGLTERPMDEPTEGPTDESTDRRTTRLTRPLL